MQEGDPGESSQAQIRRGVGHLGGAAAVVRVIDALASFYLLRLLSAEDMGLAALATSVTVILESVCGLGVRTSIVAARSISEPERGDLLGMTTTTGIGFSLLAMLVAVPLASVYEAPSLQAMVMVSGMKLLFFSLAIVPQALLARELRFGALGTLQSVGAAVGAVGKVGLAHLGLGAWSLVWANVLSTFAVLLCTWWFLWPGLPRLHFRRAGVRWHLQFGGRAALSGLLTEGAKNVDYFLVGAFLGVAPLGAYRVAFDVAMIPLESIAQPIYRVTFSVFSRIGEQTERLRQAFLEATRTMIGLCAPVVAILFFAADDLFAVIAKGSWQASIPALRILAWAALLRCVTRLFDNLFYARHQPNLALLDSVLTFALLSVAMPLGLTLYGGSYGVLVPCQVWLWSYPVIFLVLFAKALNSGALSLTGYLRGVAPALAASLVTVAVTALAAFLVSDWHSAWLRLVCVVAAAAVSYLLVVRYTKRRVSDIGRAGKRTV